MLHDYMKHAYDRLVQQVYDGKNTFDRSEGYEIFSAAFLLALKSTMTEENHKPLAASTIAQVVTDGFLPS